MEKLDFLSGETPAELTAPAVEIEPTDGPARGPDGKFISQQPEPAPEPIPAPDPAPLAEAPVPVPPAPEPGHVPLAAMLDERDKRQKLEAEVAEFRRLQAQQQSQRQAPDPYEDPVAHTQNAVLNAKLDMSEEMARGKHGDELVEKAREWAMAKMGQSPAFQQEVLSNRHPYEFAVQAFQRDQIVSQLKPSDLEQFKAWQAAQAAIQSLPAAAPAAIPQPVAAPPRSLASATSAGGVQHVPTGPGQAYDALFRK